MLDQDYSIQYLSEKIYNGKTRKYFNEVLQSFNNNTNRACIVSLYSVVICDIIFKLQELEELHSDKTAEKILKDIDSMQVASPESAEWEAKLITFVSDRTTIFEVHEILAIRQLRALRHLSAHPVLSEKSILHTPNRETVAAHVKNMLQYVLVKPPFFSKKLADKVIVDLAENREHLLVGKRLSHYLEVKYLRHSNNAFINSLFRLLWKLTFKLDNEKCRINRFINFLTIKELCNKYGESIIGFIEDERDFYDFVAVDTINPSFSVLMFKYPKLYHSLSDQTKMKIDQAIEDDLNFKILSWFKYVEIEDYLTMVKSTISCNVTINLSVISNVVELLEQFGKGGQIYDSLIEYFGSSSNFNTADKRSSFLISPYLNKFSKQQLETLIERIESNDQIYNRMRSKIDNPIIADALRKIDSDYDFSRFTKFNGY